MTDAIEEYLEGAPVLERVLPVNLEAQVRGGGRTVLASIEVWSNGTVLRWASVAHAPLQAPADASESVFTLSDDLGREYRPAGMSAGGGEQMTLGSSSFTPHLDPAAHFVRVFVPHGVDDAPIEVRLS